MPGYNNDSVLQYALIHVDPYGQYSGRARLSNSGKNSGLPYALSLTEKPTDDLTKFSDTRILYADTMTGSANDELIWTSTRFTFRQQQNQADALGEGQRFVLTDVEYRDCFGNWVTPSYKQINSYQAPAVPRAVLTAYYDSIAILNHIYPSETRGVLAAKYQRAVMHLFIVANTLDPDIGEAAKADVANITKTFEEIAVKLGIGKPFVRTYSGTNFNKAAIIRDLTNLRSRSGDIIIFYYTGHGFRGRQDETIFPRINFNTPDSPFDENNSLKIAEVNNILKNKKANFTLVLSDCCNRDVPSPSVRGPQSLGTRNVRLPFDFNNAYNLFFPQTPSNLVVTAAKPQQLAGCNPREGSYFTINFYLTLLYGVSTHPQYKNRGWNSLLGEVKTFTEHRGKTASIIQTVDWIKK